MRGAEARGEGDTGVLAADPHCPTTESNNTVKQPRSNLKQKRRAPGLMLLHLGIRIRRGKGGKHGQRRIKMNQEWIGLSVSVPDFFGVTLLNDGNCFPLGIFKPIIPTVFAALSTQQEWIAVNSITWLRGE